MEQNKTKENLVYLSIWFLLLLTPIISMTVRIAGDTEETFSWKEIFISWKILVPFLIVFLIHNYMVAPLLIYKKKKITYAAITICLLAASQLYECSHRPKFHQGPPPFEMERGGKNDMPSDAKAADKQWPEISRRRDGLHHRGPHKPPIMIGQREIISIIVMVLMMGVNLGVKYYFKSRQDAKAMEELEKKSLEQQLEYLKYQINPHFFMNTLNNIHALVDIDPEEAKNSILELSKMMRYVLYEGAKSEVPLQKEIDFLNNYITLMKLRYTDKVKINIDFPEKPVNKMVPPMLLITFVENAFKHGVSYQKESFITAKITTENDTLHFACKNSKTSNNSNNTQGGVGLANTRQRLNLIYADHYTLNISDNADTYDVELEIPFLTTQRNNA